MADWSLLRNTLSTEDDIALATYGARPTAGAANVKGSYTEIVASLPRSCFGFLLTMRGYSAGYTLMDIAIGAGGSEINVVSNLHASVSLSGDGNTAIFIPLYIPGGTRVACRFQSSIGGFTITLKTTFLYDHFAGMQAIVSGYETWGAVTAASRGTIITSSASANTKGSYTELIAATARTTKWLILGIQAFGSPRDYALDIAVGAAASEQVLLSNLYFGNHSLGLRLSFPFSIPGGSRVSARAACTTGSSQIWVEILGGY